MEGSRTLFLEVQALVVENTYGNGRRTTQGIDPNRLSMLVAVVEKYFGIPLAANDIYLNLTGGLKVKSRDIDLSIIASIISSLKNRTVPSDKVFLGEVGLSGEVRTVPFLESRIKEMVQLNYKTLIMSERSAKTMQAKYSDIEIIGVKKASQILDFF